MPRQPKKIMNHRILRLLLSQHKLAREALAMQIGQAQSDPDHDYWENQDRLLRSEYKEIRRWIIGK